VSTLSPAPAVDLARRLLDFLQQGRRRLSPLLILTHDHPDPDALAAAFALKYLVEQKFGIEAKIAYGGVIGRTENRAMVQILKIPVHKLRAAWLKRYRQIALVDTQPQFANNSFPKNRKATIVVDQHAAAVPPAADLA
jgi:nanoRNase/pAp phosphatase (c-di-AMP/oligoRNAs hydrolase)